MSGNCASEATEGDRHAHEGGGGHGHSHGGGGGHGHSHSHAPEDPGGMSLFGFIDRERVTCLNEKAEGMGKRCIKPWDMRLDREQFLDSDDDDPQLIITVPFTVAVKLKSFCVVGGSSLTCPSRVRLFVNRDDVDFGIAEELKPTQAFDLHEDPEARIDYPLQAHKFQNISSISLFFEDSIGEETTRITYLGFKGEPTLARRGIVETTYEASASMKDHTTTRADKFEQGDSVS